MSLDKPLLIVALITVALITLTAVLPASAQSPQKTVALEQDLIRTETGFFEAWKTKDVSYFRSHITDNGVFWGEYGTFSRQQQLEEQQNSAKTCTVQGYSLSSFGVSTVTAGAYLLTYRAEQYATCGGEKIPVHMNGSSIYIFKEGRWQAVYRAEVPLKDQG